MDNLETGSTEEESISSADAFYSESEPVKPTELAEEEGEAELDSEDEASEAEEVDADSDQSQAELEDDEEVQVFDKPNDFAKYEIDEESGLYEFKSMGKKVKVNIETLINNFQADQKLNVELEKLAKAKKGEFDGTKAQELEVLRGESEKMQELSSKLESLITETDEKIDWDELRDIDPSEYLKQKELKQKRQEALDQTKKERAAKIEERQQQVRDQQAVILRESVPEWADQEVMARDAGEMREHIFSKGFSQEEVNQLHDARFWLLVKDSNELAKIKQKQSQIKEVKNPPKSTKSKRAPAAKKSEDRSTADIFYS